MVRRLARFACLVTLFTLSLTLSGCFQTALTDDALCRTARKNVALAADGDSAPMPVDVLAGQRLTIRYLASYTAGTVEYQVLDQQAKILGRGTLPPSATPTTITPEVNLSAGTYTVILRFNGVGQHTICWLAIPE